MKKHLFSLLFITLLLSLTTVAALAVPEVTENVGDDHGIVTTVVTDGTTVEGDVTTSPVTLPVTTLPVTTSPVTTAPVTTAPTTTGMTEADAGGSIMAIIVAIVIAAAIVALVVILLPKTRGKRS